MVLLCTYVCKQFLWLLAIIRNSVLFNKLYSWWLGRRKLFPARLDPLYKSNRKASRKGLVLNYNLILEQKSMRFNFSWCLIHGTADGFGSCFLFSLETQHTIGYGSRQTTTHCTEAMIVVSLQAVLGCIIQAFMVGLVFSKLSRPRNRSKTIIFSSHAIITMRNKKLCLVIRIGDLREDNFILDTQVGVIMVH